MRAGGRGCGIACCSATAAARWQSRGQYGAIEVEIDGVTIRVGSGADAKTLIVVLRALKAGT
jgi:hypothetical protein